MRALLHNTSKKKQQAAFFVYSNSADERYAELFPFPFHSHDEPTEFSRFSLQRGGKSPGIVYGCVNIAQFNVAAVSQGKSQDTQELRHQKKKTTKMLRKLNQLRHHKDERFIWLISIQLVLEMCLSFEVCVLRVG